MVQRLRTTTTTTEHNDRPLNRWSNEMKTRLEMANGVCISTTKDGGGGFFGGVNEAWTTASASLDAGNDR